MMKKNKKTFRPGNGEQNPYEVSFQAFFLKRQTFFRSQPGNIKNKFNLLQINS